MNIRRRHPATTLNENDRRMLEKYTKFYTNFIESSTAQAGALDAKRLSSNPGHQDK